MKNMVTTGCSICSGVGLYVWSYEEDRGEMMPSVTLDVERDGVPDEVCCAACALDRHGVDMSTMDEVN